MTQRPITASDIEINKPLPWDIFDANGNLLLRKNLVVNSLKQVEALVERGLFIDANQAGHKAAEPVPAQDKPSAVREINLASKRLEKLLHGMLHHAEGLDAPARLPEITRGILEAIKLDRDIALATVLLNQESQEYAIRHSVDVAIVSALVAQTMEKAAEEVAVVIETALTMNVGMLLHHQKFHHKQEPLSAEEKEIIHSHPRAGVEILKQSGIDNEQLLRCVELHHENEDGSGYPHGRKSEEIPVCAKIVSMADRYCARVSARSYRKAVLANVALREIFLEGGKGIDPKIAAYFIKELGIYPPGTFVRLQSGEIGVVTHRGSAATTPVVHALVGPRGAPLSFPIKRATDKETHTIREALHAEQAAIRFSMQQVWGDTAAL